MARQSRLSIERLEDRCVPATWGNPWPDAAHLTVSFAPDGTQLGDQTSTLFQTLSAVAPTATWQRAVLRAFQTWAVEAGINFGFVGDGGQAFGTAGRPQSDSRFGDVRIGGFDFSSEVLAITSPFDLTAGTASGDVRFNSPLWANGSTYDLYTAMLQEAGHVLGIGNSPDVGSAMYEEYLGVRSGLSAADVAAIQALYGQRLADSFEGSAGNNTLANAARLNLLKDANGLLTVTADADLGKGDRDYYSVTMPGLLPGLLGGVEIKLQRAGLSLLTPRVTVYDSLGKVVGSAVSTDPTGGDLTIRLDKVKALGTYRIAVEGASGDVFDVGSYRLQIRTLPVVNSVTSLLGGVVGGVVQTVGLDLLNNDLHTNDSFLTAGLLGSLLAPLTTQTTSRFDVSYRASISDGHDVDFYRVTAGSGGVMQVMAWGIGNSQLLPRVTVYDSARNAVAAEVLVNEAGVVTVQVKGVKAGSTYYVKVESAVDSGAAATGNYFLGIDFTDKATQMATLAQGTLDATKPSEQGTLGVRRTGVFHFVIGAEGAGMGVELAIVDRAGAVVGSVRATNGESVSLTLTLTAGDYAVRMTAFSTDGQGIRPVRYLLRGIVLSDPIGPQPEDTTDQPTQAPPSSTSTTTSEPPPPTYTTTEASGTTSEPPPDDSTWYSWSDSPSTTSEPPPSQEPSYESWYYWSPPPSANDPPPQEQPPSGESWYSWSDSSSSGGTTTYAGPGSEDPAGSGFNA